MTTPKCLHCVIGDWLVEQPWYEDCDGSELISALLENAYDLISVAPPERCKELLVAVLARHSKEARAIAGGTYKQDGAAVTTH